MNNIVTTQATNVQSSLAERYDGLTIDAAQARVECTVQVSHDVSRMQNWSTLAGLTNDQLLLTTHYSLQTVAPVAASHVSAAANHIPVGANHTPVGANHTAVAANHTVVGAEHTNNIQAALLGQLYQSSLGFETT